MRYISMDLKGESYECFVKHGNIVNIYKEEVLAGGIRAAYAISRLNGVWLTIASILAEKGELNV